MDKKFIEEYDRKQKASKHKRNKQTSQPKSKQSKVEEPSTSYRDRAKERREGINKDFELDPDDLVISNPIEESKYLGGDVEHTHLVKGLDFALLERVKSDQRLAEKLEVSGSRELFGGSDSDSDEVDEAIIAASSKDQLLLEKLKKGQSKFVPCRTALARRILEVLDEKWPEKSELFLPGRMTYLIPVDEDQNITTILRSAREERL